MEAWRMRTIRAGVEEGLAPLSFAPACMHQHPGAIGNTPVLALPGLDMRDFKQKSRGFFNLGGDIDDTGRPDKTAYRYGVGGVIGQVFARNPVHRSVKMRAGVLAQIEHIPVPGRSTLVITRNF